MLSDYKSNDESNSLHPQVHTLALPEREAGLGIQHDVPRLVDSDLAQIRSVSLQETDTLILFEKAAYVVHQVLVWLVIDCIHVTSCHWLPFCNSCHMRNCC